MSAKPEDLEPWTVWRRRRGATTVAVLAVVTDPKRGEVVQYCYTGSVSCWSVPVWVFLKDWIPVRED